MSRRTKLDWLLSALFQMVDLERGVAALAGRRGAVLPALRQAVEAVLPKAERKEIQFQVEESRQRELAETSCFLTPNGRKKCLSTFWKMESSTAQRAL